MSTTTTNYGLTKPDGTDNADITVLNDNLDKIDTQMKSNADAAAVIATTTTPGKVEISTAPTNGQTPVAVSTTDPVYQNAARKDQANTFTAHQTLGAQGVATASQNFASFIAQFSRSIYSSGAAQTKTSGLHVDINGILNWLNESGTSVLEIDQSGNGVFSGTLTTKQLISNEQHSFNIIPISGGIIGLVNNANTKYGLKVIDGSNPSAYTLNNTLDDGNGKMLISAVTSRQFGVNNWADLSADTNGYALFANNAYTDNAGDFRYSNTHSSIGARGIRLANSGNGTDLQFFTTGNNVATTADATFTPSWKNIIVDDGNGNIPQQAWIAPTLQNGWVNYGGGDASARYFKDSLGMVHLSGVIANGVVTSGTVLFTLPAGYRPSASLIIPTLCKNSSGTLINTDLIVLTNGNVTLGELNAANTWLTLENITFKGEQ